MESPQLTLYVHHSLADGHHLAELLLELFSRYTDVVCTGSAGPANTQPAPESLEALLERRGIRKHQRSGLERFIPAMFAYELPPPRSPEQVGNPAQPVAGPAARGRLTERETTALVEFGQAHRLFLNSLLSAAILLAEWQLRNNPDIPIPYVYVVDLRSLLEPPVPPMGATNPLGMATYLAAIKPTTNLVDLAHDVAKAFQADLSDGVIQQSMLHFKPQYDEANEGYPMSSLQRTLVELLICALLRTWRWPTGKRRFIDPPRYSICIRLERSGINWPLSVIPTPPSPSGRLIWCFRFCAKPRSIISDEEGPGADCFIDFQRARTRSGGIAASRRSGGTARTRRPANRNAADARLNVLASKNVTAMSNRTPGTRLRMSCRTIDGPVAASNPTAAPTCASSATGLRASCRSRSAVRRTGTGRRRVAAARNLRAPSDTC